MQPGVLQIRLELSAEGDPVSRLKLPLISNSAGIFPCKRKCEITANCANQSSPKELNHDGTDGCRIDARAVPRATTDSTKTFIAISPRHRI